MNNFGDECPHCKEHKLEPLGILMLIRGDEPYNVDHLECTECGSTYNLDYYPLWQEEINNIASEACDVVQEKLDVYRLKLPVDKENELYDLLLNFLDQYGYGDYKNHN